MQHRVAEIFILSFIGVNNLIFQEYISRKKPKTIMQPLFTSSKHLVNLFTVSVELKRWSVTDVKSGLRALVNICINKLDPFETAAKLLERRKRLATNSTPTQQKHLSLRHFTEQFVSIMKQRPSQYHEAPQLITACKLKSKKINLDYEESSLGRS